MSDISYLRKLMGAVDSPKKIIAIVAGRFHPFHKGHAAMYAFMVREYGANQTFISTSGKIDPPKSPFTFAEKKKMIEYAGVDPRVVAQCSQPYVPIEILQHFEPETDSVVFAVSEKDMAEDPRFTFAPKKNGEPSYFQRWQSDETMEPFNTHGYIRIAPTLDFEVNGEPMRSASEFRANFARADKKTQAAMIADLYGSYDPLVHKIMAGRL